MTKLFASLLLVAATSGCGTLFNKKHVDLSTDPGVTVEGGTSDVSQKESHEVTYSDGRTCTLSPSVSIGYVILDIFTTGPIGLIVDGITGDWKVLKGCPGVYRD